MWVPPTKTIKAPAPVVAVKVQPRVDFKVVARTSFRLVWLPLGKLTEELVTLGMGLRFAEGMEVEAGDGKVR